MIDIASMVFGLLVGIIATAGFFIFKRNQEQHSAIIEANKLIDRNNELIDQVSRIIRFNNELVDRNNKNEQLIEEAIEEMQSHVYI